MSRDTKKLFSIFWVIVAVIWFVVGIKHLNEGDDMVIVGIYMATVAISFIVALSFYLSFRKSDK